jgi:hypothetical protein
MARFHIGISEPPIKGAEEVSLHELLWVPSIPNCSSYRGRPPALHSIFLIVMVEASLRRRRSPCQFPLDNLWFIKLMVLP